MEKKFNFVHYKIVQYLKDLETGKYLKQPQKVEFSKLPSVLKIETTREKRLINQGANEVITSSIKKGKYLFFTGLIPFSENFYFGNDYEYINGQKKNSLCVFYLSNDFKSLTVYYFNRFYKDRREERIKFIASFIEHLKLD